MRDVLATTRCYVRSKTGENLERLADADVALLFWYLSVENILAIAGEDKPLRTLECDDFLKTRNVALAWFVSTLTSLPVIRSTERSWRTFEPIIPKKEGPSIVESGRKPWQAQAPSTHSKSRPHLLMPLIGTFQRRSCWGVYDNSTSRTAHLGTHSAHGSVRRRYCVVMDIKVHLIAMPMAHPMNPSCQLGYLHSFLDNKYGNRISVNSYSAFLEIMYEFAGKRLNEFFLR
jgi:hypothetical protein